TASHGERRERARLGNDGDEAAARGERGAGEGERRALSSLLGAFLGRERAHGHTRLELREGSGERVEERVRELRVAFEQQPARAEAAALVEERDVERDSLRELLAPSPVRDGLRVRRENAESRAVPVQAHSGRERRSELVQGDVAAVSEQSVAGLR